MKKLLAALLVLTNVALIAQPELKMPEASQKSLVSQRIGLTDLTISYHSPLVKGRKIWGGVVPYNEVWRAGANENTTFTTTTDILVEGKSLPAGTYGLHMIPGEKEWTIIFSKDAEAWGSYFYNQKNDALRITVSPRAAAMQEWLGYTIAPSESSASVILHWEKLEVPFSISVDVPEMVFRNMQKELTGINGFYWQSYEQAASYCIDRNIHLDDAEMWIDRSIKSHPAFSNMNTKALLLEKRGKAEEAAAMRKKAMTVASEADLNSYGYQLLSEGKTKEALEIFERNVKTYPDSWNAYDSLGDALNTSGDKKAALENFNKALKKAPVDQKERIQKMITKLSA